MTNDELKKKIVEVVLNSEITGIQIRAITGGYSNNIADALISAGLRFGENLTATFNHMALEREHELERRLAEAEHRAARAERAFSKLVHEMYEHGIRPMCDEKFFLESRLKDAEKELEEEKKSD